jgi:hypothetical protein
MLICATHHFLHKGQPARLRVIRNNGNCWAEVKTADGSRYSVQTAFDWYDYPSEEAEQGLARAFKRGRGVEPSAMTHLEDLFD